MGESIDGGLQHPHRVLGTQTGLIQKVSDCVGEVLICQCLHRAQRLLGDLSFVIYARPVDVSVGIVAQRAVITGAEASPRASPAAQGLLRLPRATRGKIGLRGTPPGGEAVPDESWRTIRGQARKR